MTDTTLFRVVIALAGLAWIAYIWFAGRRRAPQGERLGSRKSAPRRAASGERLEPSIGDTETVANDGLDPELKAELDRLSSAVAEQRNEPVAQELPFKQRPNVGIRPEAAPIDRIVTLFVAARPGEFISGSELIVAAEKAGLEFGDKDIFHRPVEGKPDAGPVFSVANMVKPGNFDLHRIHELRTPGVTFFMTLPGPQSALDAWETMLPAAQRLAELLDGIVLDEERNALGRQTIQHIRDELRAYDRKQDKQVIKKSW